MSDIKYGLGWSHFRNHRRARNKRIRVVLAVVAGLAALGLLVYSVETAHGEGRGNYTAHMPVIAAPMLVTSGTGVVTRTVEVK